jgi:hypothetical protein
VWQANSAFSSVSSALQPLASFVKQK